MAVVLVAAQVATETVHIVTRTELRPALRSLLLVAVILQALFGLGVLQRRPGAALGLLVIESTVLLAALTGDLALAARLTLAASAVIVLVLLAIASSAFPTATLPKR